ncbi:bifunctional tetrahydrofolate synthase/dihydrofolate synthase [Aliiglaciecola sp. 3_MG-2023]|uniref:bifunctional tetrahydrofolate synthase/dihydrofolate synthase n=1 Tax=Aliiglaciecola sp. 3_MG-2023 TaxID=3062644 RepID=UPI0026E18F4D|nr:bifunctional tetrahydrofolate synthase/dihydrofolate synthase [Aliiglaciecola sp. 3_MG-2023]MDO6695303.1 bifunctional tetrahydrofolate synthase/dihydrofolate synthase [Aliiglaciecola sp. 3_MG-2023]
MTDNISSEDQHKPSLSWSLSTWLEYLQGIHSKSIDMGLSRSQQIYARLKLDFSNSTVITVAGTNGKGTTCRMIEMGLLIQQQSVAVYSSPHIIDYTERVRINGQMLSEQAHVNAFMQVERARGDVSLTYFEFATLAGLVLIANHQPNFVVLEVGLGGRLDAVNIVDPNIAVITSIALDHQDYLGDTRELIATEKSGIMRDNIPVVIGEPDPPITLFTAVEKRQAQPYWQGKEFGYKDCETNWCWYNGDNQFSDLTLPLIPMQNASTALQVLSVLGHLPSNQDKLKELIDQSTLPGRFEVISHNPKIVLDVAHNPQATELLASRIERLEYQQLHLVVAMLEDKDIAGSLLPLVSMNANWYVASLNVPRGAKSKQLKTVLTDSQKVVEFESVSDALHEAKKNAKHDDLIIVFGSFFTVSEVIQAS